MSDSTIITYRFRLRDTATKDLDRQARAVNFVWNYCNETQKIAVDRNRKWLTGYDLQKLTAGSSKELGLHAHTIQQVCTYYDNARRQKNKPRLRWRTKKSLGWVPFNTGHVRFVDGGFRFNGKTFKAWVSRELHEGQTFGAGSFSRDASGHWYINVRVNVELRANSATGVVGIDLGLKDMATMSDGQRIEHPHWYAKMQQKIAMAQRAKKIRQVRSLNAKVKAKRADYLHKASSNIVNSYAAIFIGDVNSARLAKTKMAKSVFDAGWSEFRNQLAYKAIRHRVIFKVVNETFSTQTCSDCGFIGGPAGLKGLRVRQWTCSQCGAEHDRDINAAQNIARRGLATLAEGASMQGNILASGAVNTTGEVFPSNKEVER